MHFIDLGVVPYEDALLRQEETVEKISKDGRSDETVYLLEHPHVFTLGRIGKVENLLVSQSHQEETIDVFRTNRGGDITYHGPGQLVGYPHLDLRRRGRDVHLYLRTLEKSLINTVAELGVDSFVRSGLTGVWTKEGKLASIGVGIRQWITMHGFALNVNTDLRYFRLINPCGMRDCPVTSLHLLLGEQVDLAEVKAIFRKCFEEVFASSPSE